MLNFSCPNITQCELQKVGFKEDIGVFLSDSGNIVGVDYRVPKMTIVKECDATKVRIVRTPGLCFMIIVIFFRTDQGCADLPDAHFHL